MNEEKSSPWSEESHGQKRGKRPGTENQAAGGRRPGRKRPLSEAAGGKPAQHYGSKIPKDAGSAVSPHGRRTPRVPHVKGSAQDVPPAQHSHERQRDDHHPHKWQRDNHSADNHGRTHAGGFSEFQHRLIMSILGSVFTEKLRLDRAYAIWFARVKLRPVEQGFLTGCINEMFARLSLFAYAAGLKRPADFNRHISRLPFVYSAFRGWPLPELDPKEGIDRGVMRTRLQEANHNPLLRTGCPLWLNDLGRKDYGDEWPKIREVLGTAPGRFIRVNTLKTGRRKLADALQDEGIATKAVSGFDLALEVTSSSALFRTAAFRNGMFEQQDCGSQAIGAFTGAAPGMRVVDACAGAGGKTLQLAAMMHGSGTLLALDTVKWKLDELKERARRAGAFNIITRLITSGKQYKRLSGSADVVLVDAPCSGTGTVRRSPDGKWRDLSASLAELTATQTDLLTKCSRMVKPGGVMIYATCSLLRCENEQMVAAFLDKCGGEFTLEAENHLLPTAVNDGFYMARLRRSTAQAPEAQEKAVPDKESTD